ncbi:AI-2E family transporter [Microvirga roseola]|uniref:AI-2E family transporter n=1 Tax=Microvirga roseola TaxID=2883126 RepID=UPI001E2CFA79|nr:AI-2E family transporter [Microvirga roseola]
MADPGETHGLPRTMPDARRAALNDRYFSRDWDFFRRGLITLILIGLGYFLWLTAAVLPLIFAAILLAVLLSAFADLIARYTPVSQKWSLMTATILVALLLAGFFILFGSQISGQVTQLINMLPEAIDAVGERFGVASATQQIEEAIAGRSNLSTLSQAAGFGYNIIGALANLALVIVAAIYLAADPKLYRRGTVKLLPPSQHERIFDAMDLAGNALRLWFAGQLITMAIVGVVSGLAYWWIGLPSPVALGLIAGVTNFVPFLGPILGAIPAVIFALVMNLETVLWTLGAVLVIQQLEGNVITPYIQRRAVSLPPVLALFAILIFGLLFGLVGIFLAVPLAVTLSVLVKKLWVRQTLGEETEIPGEDAVRDEPTVR